jgi:hypothetical protein
MGFSDLVHYFSTSMDDNKIIFCIVTAIIITLVVDTSVIKIYYFSLDQAPLDWRMNAFIVICCVFVVGLYILSTFAKHRSLEIRARKSLRMNALHKIVIASLYASIVIIGLLVVQIILISGYSVVLLTIATWISYTTAIIMMTVLAFRFFSWFMSNRNSVVLLYGLSSTALAINAAFTIAFVNVVLMNTPAFVVPHTAVGYPFFSLGPATEMISYGYVISSIASFMLWWIATIHVLRHYSERSRMKRSWIALIIPLIYFLLQFQPLFLNLFSAFLNYDPILFSIVYTLTFTLSKPIGGILFGIAFWSIARKLIHNTTVRNYMIASAFGLVLVFVSNQAAVLLSAPYPPFGVATASFVGLASYLVLVGIYSSAISVAEDSKLRQSIRNLAMEESRLLDSIGTAEMEQRIERRVIEITKRNQDRMTEESGVRSSVTEDDMKKYLDEVIKEIEKGRQQG